MKACTQLKLETDLHAACKPIQRGTRPALDALMKDVIDGIAKVAEWVSQTYFSHAAISPTVQRGGEEKPR